MADAPINPQTHSDATTNQAIRDRVLHDRARMPTKFVDDELIKSIWQDLDGRVSHEQIMQTANEVAARYADARVMTFIPIFIRRQTLERLKHS